MKNNVLRKPLLRKPPKRQMLRLLKTLHPERNRPGM